MALTKAIRAPGARHLLLVGVLTAAGMGCSSNDPPDWSAIRAAGPGGAGQGAAAAATADEMVVYLDMSASMAGYVSPDGRNIYGRTLQEIRNVATTLEQPVSVAVRRVDGTVGPPLPDTLLTKASMDRGLYTGAETNLAGAIGTFPASLRGAKGPPPRFHVLVSDGVQSRKQDSLDLSCAAGSDQVCVRKRILELLQKGWAGCVLGFRSPFNGTIYSEVARGVKFQYASRPGDARSYRPFFLYVFSPDPSALPKLVHALAFRLQPVLGAEPLRALPLSDAYAEGPCEAEVQVAAEARDLLERTAAQGQPGPSFTLRASLGTEKRGPQPLAVRLKVRWTEVARMSGAPADLAGLLAWEFEELEGPWSREGGARYPVLVKAGQAPDAEGCAVVTATVQWPMSTGSPGWRAYRLVGRLDLREKTPPWVREWSTDLDTSPSDGNKTLYLESQLLGLWANRTLQDKAVAEAWFRVGGF